MSPVRSSSTLTEIAGRLSKLAEDIAALVIAVDAVDGIDDADVEALEAVSLPGSSLKDFETVESSMGSALGAVVDAAEITAEDDIS